MEFNHGDNKVPWKDGSKYYQFIEPFLKRVHSFNPSTDGDIKIFFKDQLNNAINHRGEYERTPFWIENVDIWIKNQESMICAILLKFLLNSKNIELDESDIKNFMTYLYKIGENRGWDFDYFSFNLHKALMNQVEIYDTNILPVFPRVLKDTDYN